MSLLIHLAIMVGAVYVLWRAWTMVGTRPVFVVRMGLKGPRVTTGKVTSEFLGVIREVGDEFRVVRGWIKGSAEPGGTKIRLDFSANFPAMARQRLRNWWGALGWRAARPKGSKSDRRA